MDSSDVSKKATTQREISRQALVFGWQVEAGRLHCRLQASTHGWVLVGFNTRPGLDGARLVFTRVRAGRPEAEEHITDFAFPPPYHRPKTELRGRNNARDVAGSELGRATFTRFSIPLDSGEKRDIRLEPGKSYHVILAYSSEDDFDHHSQMRTSVELTL